MLAYEAQFDFLKEYCEVVYLPRTEGISTTKIKQDLFESLCGLQCTLEEIAGVLGCSEDTVERWCKRTYSLGFADAYKKHSARGKMSLRRAQFRLAEKSAAMAIFLGKNYLDQHDSFEYTDEDALAKLDAVLAEIKGVE